MHPNTIPLALDVQMFMRLLVAVVLGALVGYERERAGKPAGVWTHGIVSLGAALFAGISLHGFGELATGPAWPRRSSPASGFWARAPFYPSVAAFTG